MCFENQKLNIITKLDINSKFSSRKIIIDVSLILSTDKLSSRAMDELLGDCVANWDEIWSKIGNRPSASLKKRVS